MMPVGSPRQWKRSAPARVWSAAKGRGERERPIQGKEGNGAGPLGRLGRRSKSRAPTPSRWWTVVVVALLVAACVAAELSSAAASWAWVLPSQVKTPVPSLLLQRLVAQLILHRYVPLTNHCCCLSLLSATKFLPEPIRPCAVEVVPLRSKQTVPLAIASLVLRNSCGLVRYRSRWSSAHV